MADAEEVLISVDRSVPWHACGHIAFGPKDGHRYACLGGSDCHGAPKRTAQKLQVLYGNILRIDVSLSSGYAIPAGNPFAGASDVRPEIWAFGLRNPWPFAFDP